jgi:hypothetical protein
MMAVVADVIKIYADGKQKRAQILSSFLFTLGVLKVELISEITNK